MRSINQTFTKNKRGLDYSEPGINCVCTDTSSRKLIKVFIFNEFKNRKATAIKKCNIHSGSPEAGTSILPLNGNFSRTKVHFL